MEAASADRISERSGPPPASSLAVLLEQRAASAARWRRLAASLRPIVADPLSERLARLTVAESEHTARLVRDRPLIEVAGVLPRADPSTDAVTTALEGAGDAADLAARLAPFAAALEQALTHEHRLREAFEHLASVAVNPETRLQALGLALAETRQLTALQDALAEVRGNLSIARNRRP